MSGEVLPKPERLNGTRNCELAALLVTLGFEPVDRQMQVATGQGVKGGSLGYWRFLPNPPALGYSLKAVLRYGVDVRKMARAAAHEVAGEQLWIAAGYHNFRLLVENMMHGGALRLVRLQSWNMSGPWVLQRADGGEGMREECGMVALREFMATGTRNTELAAALVTLGFEPDAAVTGGLKVQHEARGRVWMFAPVSVDGRWQLQERIFRWQDDIWCGQPENNDPIACLADGFYNLRQLRRGLRDAQVWVRAQNGRRSVMVKRDADASVWAKAERFLSK
jgi:hypothetical protein